MSQDGRAAALLKRLALRLDDGTVIRGNGGEGGTVALLTPAAAYAAGTLTEAHLLKAQALLCEIHAKLPEEGPLRSLSLGSKRSVDTGFEVGPTGSGKRSRSLGGHYTNGTEDVHMESPTSAPLTHQHATYHGGPPGKAPGPPAPYHAPPPAAVAPPATAAAPPPMQQQQHYAPPAPPPQHQQQQQAAPAVHHAPAPARPVAGPSRAEWTAACNRIVDNIVKNLGPADSPIFYEPVNPTAVSDYYQVVKTPVCLKDVRQRLSTGQYAGPEGFYQDMDQLVYNCLLYNPHGSYVRTLGQKIEQRWLDNWRRNPMLAGFVVHRQAKPIGGKPMPKSKQAAVPPRPQRSSGGAPRRPPPKAQQQAAAPPRVPRTTSVNSYKNYQALPAEQQAQLAEALQDEAVLTEKMDGVVAILQKANQLPTNEEGEVELDLSVLSPAVVWELYEFVIGRPPMPPQLLQQQAAAAGPPGGPPGGAAAPPGGPHAARPATSGFQLQEDSDYDPYGEEEED